ncbi:MFS transporter superfamily protein [Abortiporus biennis]
MEKAPLTASDYFVPVKNRVPVAIGLGLILFISALDSTIVAVALPKIGSSFNDFQDTSWVVSAYIITYTAFLPIVAKLTDIVGRKNVLIVSTIWFMAFSGACGGSKSLTQLIVFRAIQGIGGSAIYSGVIVTISTMVPNELLPKYTSVIGTVFAVSSVAGPLVGGAIVQHIHWGWIFYVNLPIGFIGAVLLQLSLTYPASQGKIRWTDVKRRIDWIGAFVLLASSLLLALSLQIGGTPKYPWVSATVLTPLAISVILIPFFIWVETKHREPILPLRLFRLTTIPAANPSDIMSIPQTPNVLLIVLFTLCLGGALYGTTVYLPQRLQIVSSLSPVNAAVRMIPLLLPVGLLSPLAGACVIFGRSYRPLMLFSSALGAIGGGLLSTVGVNGGTSISYPKLYGFEVMEGVALGVTLTVSTIITQFSVERKDLATATGFQTFARMLGGLIGIAISAAILNARVSSKLTSAAFSNPALRDPGLRQGLTNSPSTIIPTLDPATQDVVKQAYEAAFSLILIVVGIWFAIGTLCLVPLKHVFPVEPRKKKVKKTSTGGGEGEKDVGTVEHGVHSDADDVGRDVIELDLLDHTSSKRPSMEKASGHEIDMAEVGEEEPQAPEAENKEPQASETLIDREHLDAEPDADVAIPSDKVDAVEPEHDYVVEDNVVEANADDTNVAEVVPSEVTEEPRSVQQQQHLEISTVIPVDYHN